jgi:phosphate:Na+ symporter
MAGVILVFFFVPQFASLVQAITYAYQPAAGMDMLIANTHTIFNVASAIVFLPFTKYFVRFLETLVQQKTERDWDDDDDSKAMDKLLLNTPIAAVSAAKKVINISARRSKSMLEQAMDFICAGQLSLLEEVNQSEKKLNAAQRNLTRYMVQLSKGGQSGISPSVIPALITCMNHVERTGDHAKNLVELAQIKVDSHFSFSEQALADMKDLEGIVLTMYDILAELLIDAQKTENGFQQLKALEEDVDIKAKALVDGHVRRLEEGLCTVEAGVYFMDIVNFLERISDHIYKAAKDLRAGETGAGKSV